LIKKGGKRKGVTESSWLGHQVQHRKETHSKHAKAGDANSAFHVHYAKFQSSSREPSHAPPSLGKSNNLYVADSNKGSSNALQPGSTNNDLRPGDSATLPNNPLPENDNDRFTTKTEYPSLPSRKSHTQSLACGKSQRQNHKSVSKIMKTAYMSQNGHPMETRSKRRLSILTERLSDEK
jgi:hypothetical protein